MFLLQPITHWARAVQTWCQKFRSQRSVSPLFRMNLLHHLSVPCSLNILNHYYKLISVLLSYCCENTALSQANLSPTLLCPRKEVQTSLVPVMPEVTYFWPAGTCLDSVKADSSRPGLDQPPRSDFPCLHGTLQWLQAPSFLNVRRGTTHHGTTGHARRKLVNFTAKTISLIG